MYLKIGTPKNDHLERKEKGDKPPINPPLRSLRNSSPGIGNIPSSGEILNSVGQVPICAEFQVFMLKSDKLLLVEFQILLLKP